MYKKTKLKLCKQNKKTLKTHNLCPYHDKNPSKILLHYRKMAVKSNKRSSSVPHETNLILDVDIGAGGDKQSERLCFAHRCGKMRRRSSILKKKHTVANAC